MTHTLHAQPDDFGALPPDHPQRKKRSCPNDTVSWYDRKVLTAGSGSEVRIVFGAYKNEEAVKMQPGYRPKSTGFRMRWGSDEALEEVSATGGNIQARSVR